MVDGAKSEEAHWNEFNKEADWAVGAAVKGSNDGWPRQKIIFSTYSLELQSGSLNGNYDSKYL